MTTILLRLKDINDVHDYIKNELGNITIRMETINNIDKTVKILAKQLFGSQLVLVVEF